MQPNPSSATTSSPTATRTQPPISQPNDQLASTSSSNQNHVYNPNERLSKGPVLLLGDSMIRGIQQRKFAPNRYVNKQTIAGGTREISQYINHTQERNDYDYIVIHSGTNDVGKLTANEIRTNMENCLVNLKHSNKLKPNFSSFEVIRRLNPRTYTQSHTLTVVQWGGGLWLMDPPLISILPSVESL